MAKKQAEWRPSVQQLRSLLKKAAVKTKKDSQREFELRTLARKAENKYDSFLRTNPTCRRLRSAYDRAHKTLREFTEKKQQASLLERRQLIIKLETEGPTPALLKRIAEYLNDR